MLSKALKVWNTVKYMTPRQWKYRLYYTATFGIWFRGSVFLLVLMLLEN